MKRREFIAVLGGAAVSLPLTARAQKVQRIGVMMANYAEGDPEGQASRKAFVEALNKLGWVDGGNLSIVYRWDDGDAERIKASADELVRSAPDVLVVATNPAVAVVHRLTRTIPVVFARVADPVGSGFVGGLSRPGGNMTGFQASDSALGGKWVGVLKETVPGIGRVVVLYGSDSGGNIALLQAAEAAASAAGVRLTALDVHRAADWEQQLGAFAGKPDGGLVVVAHPFTTANRKAIIAAAARYRLPAIYPYQFFARDGGLIAYGPDQIDQWRGAASYVDRILRGEKPGDLPVQAPVKYELVINQKSATALGIKVSPSVLARADEVIE